MPPRQAQKRAAVRVARLRMASGQRKVQAETEDLQARVAALEERVATLWGLPGHPGHKPHADEEKAGASDPGSQDNPLG